VRTKRERKKRQREGDRGEARREIKKLWEGEAGREREVGRESANL